MEKGLWKHFPHSFKRGCCISAMKAIRKVLVEEVKIKYNLNRLTISNEIEKTKIDINRWIIYNEIEDAKLK